ncbi:hypothetical protein COMNV_00029 [Commensalibacter sp. Nvir]|uniref:hypothetical protein n=1 Tax=Commensalibacter sp. Nvir TaxID=3069817 RepID=UPI002D7326B7|nr:hypothetical protein COMNV_00029 [Commensalibacter sp. Nvir]
MKMTSDQNEPLTGKNKGLLVIVIVLGVLIIIGTTVLIFSIINRFGHQQENIQKSLTSTIVDKPISILKEPKGTRITQIVSQSPRVLVISLKEGGVSDRLVFWDTTLQKKIAEVKLSE